MTALKKAAFLDRDGVINQDLAYVHRIEDFHFLDGVFEACRRLQAAGYALIIVTNQSGIARGYFTEAEYQQLTDWMLAQFQAERVDITAVYHCPFHPEASLEQYRQDSPYRKPGPQMLLDAAHQHRVDLPASFIAGDKASDLAAGRAAGVGHSYFIGEKSELGPEFQGVEAFSSLLGLVDAKI